MAKILIVEDDPNIANLYKKKLIDGGHTVAVSEDREAVENVGKQKPDLVLLDILMPNISGLDILRELKADAVLSATPVLLLTNVAEDMSIAKGLELGAYGYLLKAETTPEQILARVNMTLEEVGKGK